MLGSAKTFALAGTTLVVILMAGCASTPAPPIDPTATLAFDGDPLSRTAPGNGQISVLDVNQQTVIFSGYVKKDEVLTFDPMAKRLLIGNEVAAKDLHGGDEFQISFAAAP